MPCDDTVATAILLDCHDATDVRSSVVPLDNVTVAVNCAVPVAAKLDVPETATEAIVGVAGGVGSGCETGGVGLGAVGESLLLEQLTPSRARTTAIKAVNWVTPLPLQSTFRADLSRV